MAELITASEMGRKGGSSRSIVKISASRENGKKTAGVPRTNAIRIPPMVLDYMAGAELYPARAWNRNAPGLKSRAVEDAKYLVGINFSGYDGYSTLHRKRVLHFLERVKSTNPQESKDIHS